MEKDITRDTGITIGLDVSDRFTEAYAIDDRGTWVESWRIPTKQAALRAGLARYPGARVVLEVIASGLSPYFLGPDPHVIDATVFAFFSAALDAPFRSRARDMLSEAENVRAYRARIRAADF